MSKRYNWIGLTMETRNGNGTTREEYRSGPARRTEVEVIDVLIDPVTGVRTETHRTAVAGLPDNPARYDDHPFEVPTDVKARVRSYVRQTRVDRQIRALKEWRASWADKALNRAASDAVLERIAKANPTTIAELRAVEGATELLLNFAENELFQLLSKT